MEFGQRSVKDVAGYWGIATDTSVRDQYVEVRFGGSEMGGDGGDAFFACEIACESTRCLASGFHLNSDLVVNDEFVL